MKFFYEGNSRQSGIYKIVNTVSNRIYIGQTSKFERRWSDYKKNLSGRKGHNKFLINDFEKCLKFKGDDNFLEFYILEIMGNSTKEQRLLREDVWIEKYLAQNIQLYNIHLKPSEQECRFVTKQSESTKKKISENKKAFCKTEKGRNVIQKLALMKQGKSYSQLYGDEKANEIKNKIRQNKLVEMNKKEVKENLKQLLTGVSFEKRFGIKKAQKIKKKISCSKKGKFSNEESPNLKKISGIQLVSPIGELFTEICGVKIFAQRNNLSPNHLSELLAGKRKSHFGWRLIC